MPAYDLGRVFDFRRWPPDHLDRLVLRSTFQQPANHDAPLDHEEASLNAPRVPLARAAGEGHSEGEAFAFFAPRTPGARRRAMRVNSEPGEGLAS